MYICLLRLIGGINFSMSSSKKLVVNLSEALNNEFNKALKEDCKKRSEFIREAIILYIEEKKKLNNIEEMKRGYIEMAKINLEMSEMGFASDILEFKEYEAKLTESDLPDDNSSEKRRYILC
jgi:CopG family transcriptional regulator / antitoxin EndoAI